MRVLSGIQVTGDIHIGNYFGAIASWVELQNKGHDCFFFIANLHSLTAQPDPSSLKEWTLKGAAALIALGVDPSKSVLFVQSDVFEHAQLAWIFSCLMPIGEMERMIQFKEKSRQDMESANTGLLIYPLLQAADILLYQPDLVPVGIDQAQHLELTRIAVRKFNARYGNFFKEPQTLHTPTQKVLGLDGKEKMSKSKNNYIAVYEEKESLWAKLSKAATDPARKTRQDPGTPEICNVYSLHQLFSSVSDQQWSAQGCRTASIGCSECKRKLCENIEQFISPVRARYKELCANTSYLESILEQGALKARSIAHATLREVYQLVGI